MDNASVSTAVMLAIFFHLSNNNTNLFKKSDQPTSVMRRGKEKEREKSNFLIKYAEKNKQTNIYKYTV